MPDGCLVTYKPTGCSSHDMVQKVRKAFGVKAGHAGTLDPMAQGVLLIFLEKALKILQFIPPEFLDKSYLMRVTLGKSTDTYDATGNTVRCSQKMPELSSEQVLHALNTFVGTYDQTPPAYSAVKLHGKRAYALARSGQTPILQPRKVSVASIRLIRDYSVDEIRHLIMRIHCSRGTYIRSIANDLGEKLGCGAYLSYLLRERVGKWSHKDALAPARIVSGESFERTRYFVPITDLLPFPRLTVQDSALHKVKSGANLLPNDIAGCEFLSRVTALQNNFQVVNPRGELVAVYRNLASNSDGCRQGISPLRVLI